MSPETLLFQKHKILAQSLLPIDLEYEDASKFSYENSVENSIIIFQINNKLSSYTTCFLTF